MRRSDSLLLGCAVSLAPLLACFLVFLYSAVFLGPAVRRPLHTNHTAVLNIRDISNGGSHSDYYPYATVPGVSTAFTVIRRSLQREEEGKSLRALAAKARAGENVNFSSDLLSLHLEQHELAALSEYSSTLHPHFLSTQAPVLVGPVSIPAGFSWDGMTVPDLLAAVSDDAHPAAPTSLLASMAHDYLYGTPSWFSQHEAGLTTKQAVTHWNKLASDLITRAEALPGDLSPEMKPIIEGALAQVDLADLEGIPPLLRTVLSLTVFLVRPEDVETPAGVSPSLLEARRAYADAVFLHTLLRSKHTPNFSVMAFTSVRYFGATHFKMEPNSFISNSIAVSLSNGVAPWLLAAVGLVLPPLGAHLRVRRGALRRLKAHAKKAK